MTTLFVLSFIWFLGACCLDLQHRFLAGSRLPFHIAVLWPLYFAAALVVILLCVLLDPDGQPKRDARPLARRRLFITILTLCVVAAAPALGQSPAPVTLPDPVTLKITRSALQAIGQGLVKIPYETAAPILTDLQAQLNAQDKTATDAAEAAAKKAAEPAKPAEGNPALGAGPPNPASKGAPGPN